jgi:hypothetical protein
MVENDIRRRSMNTKKVSLENLLLDPNNYRIRGNENYKLIEEKDIANAMVQKRISKMICGDTKANIKDLLESFKENGYLMIDNIIVRPYKNEKYVVVEGNRRVTTLKVLKELHEDGMDIGNVNSDIFNKIDVVVYHDDDKNYEILMGLRHVSGVKEWGDYEQSQLISNLANNYMMSVKEISESLGISTITVKKRLNTYYALQIFKEDPDYGEYFTPKYSTIFYEIMGKPEIRDSWLGWDTNLNDFTNKENMRRLFSWLVPVEDEDEKETKEPIITKRDEIRALAKFINDKEALTKLEESRSVGEAKEESEHYSKEGFKKTLKAIVKNLDKLQLGAISELNGADKENIIKMLNKMEKQRNLIEKVIS